jgi:hypothetical protein
MKDFLILYKSSYSTFMAQINPSVKSYRPLMEAWMKALYKEGALCSGDMLKRNICHIVGRSRVRSENEFPDCNPVIGGYLLIKAESFEDAKKIADQCPILEFNGEVELREIMDVFYG